MEPFRRKMLVVFVTFFISVTHSLPVFQYGAPQAGDYYIAVDPYATDPYAASAYPSADSYYPAQGYPSLDSYYPSQQYPSDAYYASPQPYPSDSYYPSADSYYPAQQQYPSFDSYYQSPQPYQAVDSYQPYPSADSYYQQQPYQSLDSYYQPQPYPSVDPYASLGYQQNPYQSVDSYAYQQPSPQPYQDPYASLGYPQQAPYPSVDPYASLGYPQQAPYPSVDPYASLGYQYPQPYPSPDPYAYQQPQPYPSQDPYASLGYPQPSPPPYYPSPQPSPYPQIASSYSDPYSSPYPSALAPAPSYAVAPAYNSPQYPASQPQVEIDTYLAITSHDIETRKHCGVIAALNDAIYSPSTPGGVNDVVPYGGHPWLRFIVDEDLYSVVCLGVAINEGLILTAASCLSKPASSYSIMSDWDILTIYNQYEAYKSWSTPICTTFPLGIDNSTSQAQYVYGGEYAELILIMTNEEETSDLYPKDKVVCLPSATSYLQSYNSYPPPSPYGYPPQQPQYGQGGGLGSDRGSINGMSKGECWVAGWHSSPTAVLQNHPNPAPGDGQQPPSYNNNQQFYPTLDNSKVPRGALVRQIQCPPGYPSPGGDDVCFVGVQGYDACVADKGTGVYCVISDSKPYESGFADDSTSDHGNVLPGNTQPNYPPYQPQGQKPPIQANPAQQKPPKLRVVLYGIVKATTTCLSAPAQQSNYVVASRINPSIRAAIVDLNWAEAFDGACPSEQVDPVIPLIDPDAPGSGTYVPPYPVSAYPSTSLQPQLYDPSIYGSGDPYAPYQPSSYPQPGYPQPAPYSLSTSYPQPGYPQPAPAPYPQPGYPQPAPAPYPQPGYPQPAPYPQPYADVSYNNNPLYPQQQYQPQYPQDPLYGII